MFLKKHSHFYFLLMLLVSFKTYSASSPDGMWEYLGSQDTHQLTGIEAELPAQYGVFNLDRASLEEMLKGAEDLEEGSSARIIIPKPDGSFAEFEFLASHVLEPALAREYPEIRTFKGSLVGNKGLTIRYDLTPAGFHAQVTTEEGTYYISPFSGSQYISFFAKDFSSDDFGCEQNHMMGEDSDPFLTSLKPLINYGTSLKTYRIAVAATGEYTAAVGGTKLLALSSIATALNFINSIYEREVDVRFQLISSDANIIYTDAATDPYTPASGNIALLTQNQSTVTSVIGSANFDVGHLFHALAGTSNSGSGVATLRSVCSSTAKARGVSTATRVGVVPINPFFYRIITHELAHQFGANHSFNAPCGGNRNDATAYEPGSGTTIMSYAAGCPPYNITNLPDTFFHRISLEEISTFLTTGNGRLCGTQTSLANAIPTAEAGPSYTIPKSTPFVLTGTASDPNFNVLSFDWEQYNNEIIAGVYPQPTTLAGPVFRSFVPTNSNLRYFPRLADILNNVSPTWEVLPAVSRTMNFSLVVRDGVGGVSSDNTQITVTDTSGPFKVLSPNGGQTLRSNITVTWDRANTHLAPVSTSLVDILLSNDNGQTFPIVLANNTPNDGSQVVTLPITPSLTARIMVRAEGNVYFDVSNAPFTITP